MWYKVLAALLVCIIISLGGIALAESIPQLGEDVAIAALPGKQWELHSLTKLKVEKVSQITGEDSPNTTLSRFDVWGTDLGSMTTIGDTTYLFGGDTFSSEDSAHWRSNVLFLIQDDDPSDGLTIVDAITDRTGSAKELLGSLKIEGKEVTVIPTNIFAVDDTLYCIYMSVSHWGEAGRWDCRWSGLAVSRDGGQKWTKLNDVRWPGDSGFIQTANCQVGDTMYIWGIPGGRDGGVSLMKVTVDRIEDYAAYSYYTGMDESGTPNWVQGEEGLTQSQLVVDPSAGEISVIYNPYLGNFIMTYLSEAKHAIVMREGVTPWGPWGKEYTLAPSSIYPSLYGGYMTPKYIEQDGKVFYFAMSQYFPIYNIMWMRTELP
ncbi:hypothetical protein AGMMS49992_05170 [Clostridia bacterium]|nr:hypothetical protein AGMMS49992_05170 [Clostridia bacterium]